MYAPELIGVYVIHTLLDILLAFVLYQFYRNYGRRYLLYWAMSWTALSVRHAVGVFSNWGAINLPPTDPVRIVVRQSQKLEAVGRLAGGIAHDFNNILTVILGYSELLKAQVRDGEWAKDASEIHLAAQRASSLTNQLLAFSRKQVLEPRVLNLNEVVSGMDGLLRRLIPESIELNIDLAPRIHNVKADPSQMSQVVMNLVLTFYKSHFPERIWSGGFARYCLHQDPAVPCKRIRESAATGSPKRASFTQQIRG